MRVVDYLLVFVLFSTLASASWQMYQNNLESSGSTDEVGNFPLDTSNYSDNSLGMDF